jgi:glutaminyl-peptide cyclotransferase
MKVSVLSTLLVLCTFATPIEAKSGSQESGNSYRVLNAYPHDSGAFTQGLVFVDGHMYESTGLNGSSSLRMVDISTGKVLQRYDLPPEYFGEGLTDWGSTLVQLTWKSHKGFVYDRFTFSVLRTFDYEGEGWGLTHDKTRLIMSDGTSSLRFLNPKTFQEISRIRVTDESDRPVENINELEYIHGEVYANIWHTDRIARISPSSGKVLGWLNLTGIIDKRRLRSSDSVLNGIAYDSVEDRLFVTGKQWPELFQIELPALHIGTQKVGTKRKLSINCDSTQKRGVQATAQNQGLTRLTEFGVTSRGQHLNFSRFLLAHEKVLPNTPSRPELIRSD